MFDKQIELFPICMLIIGFNDKNTTISRFFSFSGGKVKKMNKATLIKICLQSSIVIEIPQNDK